MPAFDPPLEAGEVSVVFPDSVVERRLGGGGQGDVFKVRNPDGRTEALKIYGASVQRARVDREIQALGRLRSESIVTLHRHGTVTLRNDDCMFAAFTYIEGTTLREILRNASLPVSTAIDLIRRIAMAIDSLWALRVVHRDITPRNIMLDADGRAHLIDLALAKHLDEDPLTQLGWTHGTPGYMSPEQARGARTLSLRSDIFCLGIVAYEAISGRHPWGRNQALIGVRPPIPLNSFLNINLRLGTVVQAMLETYPVRRPSSGRAIIARLVDLHS